MIPKTQWNNGELIVQFCILFHSYCHCTASASVRHCCWPDHKEVGVFTRCADPTFNPFRDGSIFQRRSLSTVPMASIISTIDVTYCWLKVSCRMYKIWIWFPTFFSCNIFFVSQKKTILLVKKKKTFFVSQKKRDPQRRIHVNTCVIHANCKIRFTKRKVA